MKISYNWLKDYLEVDLSPDALSVLLTDCGLEVEGLEKWQSVQGGLEGIVIGEVLTCAKHPDADRLSITTVDVGHGEPLPIVCGAPNVAAGQKVVVATVGTTLYHGDESFVIKKAKLRGQPSEGMICAEDEIGLGTSHDGILVLEEGAKTGTLASAYFNVEEDYVFEIGLTPNRTDAMSHIGVARDILAVLSNRDMVEGKKQNRDLVLPDLSGFKVDSTTLDIPVELINPEACQRYAGLTISGIKVQESPTWLKNRLSAIGLRPINNIVDISNYVLHETGQPLHAFDAAKIEGEKVIVKKLPKGTKFTTLDEIERELSENDLMICSEKTGMCIGGVFGGIHSGVTEDTKAIFLESAYFDPVHIRKTSKLHDLQTDASFRFERGVDPEMTLVALKRAAMMITEIAGGTISSEIKDVVNGKFERISVKVKWENINRLIGKRIGREIILNILHALEFELIKQNDDELVLTVPLYRVDVTREADVIEEILRIYGYNNIEILSKLESSISAAKKPDPEKLKLTLSEFLTGNGFTEMMNNSLTKQEYFENNPAFSAEDTVKIYNPLSRDLNAMRQSLLFGGLETILYNQNRKNEDLKLFEFGQVYSRLHGSESSDVTTKFSENQILGILFTGRKVPESWNTTDDQSNVFDLKNICEHLLNRVGLSVDKMTISNEFSGVLDQGISYKFNKHLVMQLGSVSSAMLNDFDIKQKVYYAEIRMEAVLTIIGQMDIRYSEIPRFPEVRRDLALLLDKSIPYAEIEKIAFETERKLLKKVNLFDVYEGKNIESGKKSYALSFILQDNEKTLTDKVIDKVMRKMIQSYQHQLKATIR